MRRTLKDGAFSRSLFILFVVISLAATLVMVNGVIAKAMAQTRVVVLPFYTEEGKDARGPKFAARHYRRVIRFMNNQLVKHGFEVINPFARELTEEEYNRVMQRAREDSLLAAKDMCKKYSTEIAYIVWLKIKSYKTADGYCKAKASLDGEGYDSAGRDLGAGVYKTFIVTRRDCEDAIAEAGKEIGDLVGRKLTAHSGSRKESVVVGSGAESTSPGQSGGILARQAKKQENLIEIRLDGATEYPLSEVFGKVVNTARGVVEAKIMASSIIPNNPNASYATWRVRIEDTDPFRLQANMMNMIHSILDAGGEIQLKGVPYRYTAAEVDLLKGIRPGQTTSRSIQFVIDRDYSKDKGFEGRHDPYKARKKN